MTLPSVTALAQVGLEQHIIVDKTFGSQSPKSTYVADIDRDGFLDIISTSSDEVVWYKNLDGSGNYSKPKVITNTPSNKLDVVDVDGDGFLDVIFTGGPNNAKGIYWSKNTDGLGTFNTPVLIFAVTTFGNGYSDYQVIDHNNDKHIDILFISYPQYGDTSLNFLKNDGKGNFTRSIILSKSLNFHATDVNGDNLPDLIVRYTNELKVFNQNPDGTYAAAKTINSYSMENHFSSGDVDNDGDLDIIAIYKNGPSVVDIKWYENKDGLGTFSAAKFLVNFPNFTSELGYFTEGLKVLFCLEDFDSDGKADIVFTYTVNNKIIWFKNLGEGKFSAENIISTTSIDTQSLVTGDLNNDGNNDIVTISIAENNISWYKNNGLGKFADKQNVSNYTQNVITVESGDIDGDGAIDIICSSGYNISWFKNSNNNFSSNKLTITNNYNARNLLTTDIDHDGDLDIVFTYQDQNVFPVISKILWFENDGKGAFKAVQTILSTATPYQIRFYITDVNNDGRKDILYILNNDTVYLLKNIGNGIFAEKELIPYNDKYYIYGFYVQDMDEDGDNDIVIDNNLKVIWLENIDGLANYSINHILNIPVKDLSSIVLSDVDGDNDLDIIGQYGNKIRWFENLDGKGNFGPNKEIASTSYSQPQIYTLDIDLDGDEDIIGTAVVSDYRIPFKWYENKGSGKFETGAEIPIEFKNIITTKIADINGDGRLDLITGSYLDDKVAWIENLGPKGTLNTENPPKNNLQASLKIYPNPTRDIITIELNVSNENKLKVFDINGRFVFSKELKSASTPLNISNLANGIYLFEVSNELGSVTKKVIKK